MRKGGWSLALLSMVVLAGCSGEADPKDEPATNEETFEELELEATETTGVIRGVVVDQAIRPLGNATVTLAVPGQGKLTERTGVNGAFGFDELSPGTYFLSAKKLGYNSTQVATEVVAGIPNPKPVTVLLEENPTELPYTTSLAFEGFITCGAAIVATSVGCTTFPPVAEQLGDTYIWRMYFDTQPRWLQGELVWEQTQPAGGYLIWEIVPGGTNTPAGYRETIGSPALAYWDNATISNWWDNDNTPVSSEGASFRVFGGPHPLCTGVFFGCGLTINQDFASFIHLFYNWEPDAGWRFTVDGPPVPPE